MPPLVALEVEMWEAIWARRRRDMDGERERSRESIHESKLLKCE